MKQVAESIKRLSDGVLMRSQNPGEVICEHCGFDRQGIYLIREGGSNECVACSGITDGGGGDTE